jgi:hypothetical protein
MYKSIKICYCNVCRNRHSLFGISTLSQSVLFERSALPLRARLNSRPWLAVLSTIRHAGALVDDKTPAVQPARTHDDAGIAEVFASGSSLLARVLSTEFVFANAATKLRTARFGPQLLINNHLPAACGLGSHADPQTPTVLYRSPIRPALLHDHLRPSAFIGG